MKKRINIEKKLDFSKMISEITAISLEHDLSFIDDENIEGNLIVSGKYKSTVASQIEEVFEYKIPVDISLTEKINHSNSKVDIIDFSYDVYEDNFLNCKIELLVDGEEVVNEERECDDDPIEEKVIEIPKIEGKSEEKMYDKAKDNIRETEDEMDVESLDTENLEENKIDSNTFFNIDNSKETYGTFIVYIIRQNETINSILEKYDTSIEEIEKYNDIKDLSIGKKLIIPLLKKDE